MCEPEIKDGDIYLLPLSGEYKLCYNFKGTTRFMVLSRTQLAQLAKQINELEDI